MIDSLSIAVPLVVFVLSIAWFYAGHLLAFFVLGKIRGRGDLRTSAKAALLVFAGYVTLTIVGFAIVYGLGGGQDALMSSSNVLGALLLAYAIGMLAYLALVAWAANRFYELAIGYAVLAALCIGFVYTSVTFVIGFILQVLVFLMVM